MLNWDYNCPVCKKIVKDCPSVEILDSDNDLIIYHKGCFLKTQKCPVCNEEHDTLYEPDKVVSSKDGKLYYVHRGDCRDAFGGRP